MQNDFSTMHVLSNGQLRAMR